MPTTRSPSTRCIASVTRPAGLVKLMNRASGACRATVSAIAVTAGTVRRANAMPPAPVVSWPIDAGVHGDPLVHQPALEAADADGAVDDVGALHGVAQIAGTLR